MSTIIVKRARPRGDIRRSQILDAATQVFLENGYGGATIDLVVARAGASKATVYSFFGGKDGLFAAIITERAERILSAFGDLDTAGADVPGALAHIARRYMETILSSDVIGLHRLIIAEGVRFPDLVRTFYRLGPDRVTARLADTFSAWGASGLIRVHDPEAAARQFLHAVSGELHQRAMAGIAADDSAAAIESSINSAVQIFWRGIRSYAEHARDVE